MSENEDKFPKNIRVQLPPHYGGEEMNVEDSKKVAITAMANTYYRNIIEENKKKIKMISDRIATIKVKIEEQKKKKRIILENKDGVSDIAKLNALVRDINLQIELFEETISEQTQRKKQLERASDEATKKINNINSGQNEL